MNEIIHLKKDLKEAKEQVKVGEKILKQQFFKKKKTLTKEELITALETGYMMPTEKVLKYLKSEGENISKWQKK